MKILEVLVLYWAFICGFTAEEIKCPEPDGSFYIIDCPEGIKPSIVCALPEKFDCTRRSSVEKISQASTSESESQLPSRPSDGNVDNPRLIHPDDKNQHSERPIHNSDAKNPRFKSFKSARPIRPDTDQHSRHFANFRASHQFDNDKKTHKHNRPDYPTGRADHSRQNPNFIDSTSKRSSGSYSRKNDRRFVFANASVKNRPDVRQSHHGPSKQKSFDATQEGGKSSRATRDFFTRNSRRSQDSDTNRNLDSPHEPTDENPKLNHNHAERLEKSHSFEKPHSPSFHSKRTLEFRMSEEDLAEIRRALSNSERTDDLSSKRPEEKSRFDSVRDRGSKINNRRSAQSEIDEKSFVEKERPQIGANARNEVPSRSAYSIARRQENRSRFDSAQNGNPAFQNDVNTRTQPETSRPNERIEESPTNQRPASRELTNEKEETRRQEDDSSERFEETPKSSQRVRLDRRFSPSLESEQSRDSRPLTDGRRAAYPQRDVSQDSSEEDSDETDFDSVEIFESLRSARNVRNARTLE